MNASLCDAVVGAPGGSGEAGAQETLRALESSSVFLVPLDRRRGWYRYHALFREFLRAELGPGRADVVTKLHLRAADWYEAHGSPVRALEHLLSTTERERSVHLVTALSMPTYQAGQMSTTQRWLATLGDEAIAGYPPLVVARHPGRRAHGTGAEAERWSAILDGGDVRPAAGGRYGLVRLGSGHGPGADVRRRARADADGQRVRGRLRAPVERLAVAGSDAAGRGEPPAG